jgi:hypothetical protein
MIRFGQGFQGLQHRGGFAGLPGSQPDLAKTPLFVHPFFELINQYPLEQVPLLFTHYTE